MSLVERLKHKLGIAGAHSGRYPIRIFLLEDDERRCEWFAKRFKGDLIDVACDVPQAREFLKTRVYDSIFLDHDLMPEHYGEDTPGDEDGGFGIGSLLASIP